MNERRFGIFKKIVWAHYKKHGRHSLPWRKTRDPYHILVSEIMLQQTQVERVIPFYKKFIRQFPTAKKLAAAPLSPVLKVWQGLGYNRRAKLLREAAKELASMPRLRTRFNLVEWERLPGVGPYTARAVAAFAYNEDVVFVETNIRTAVIHHFFSKKKQVPDTEIVAVLRRTLPKGNARKWYSALMDYGAHLKHSGISHNARSAAYAKQQKFSGSLREARGALLRELARGARPRARLVTMLGAARRAQASAALQALIAEGLARARGNRVTLAD